MAMTLEITNLLIERGGFRLSVPHLVIPAGEKVAVIGENGCGKSTLMAAITGGFPQAETAVRWGGDTLGALDYPERAQRFSYLPQFPEVLFSYSVMDVALMGRFPAGGGKVTEADRTAATELLDRLDIGRYAERAVNTLSGGEKRRAMIARLLMQNTPAVVADEPASMLDIRHGRDVMQMLASLPATVIAGVHDLHLASQLFDRMLLMKNGEIRYDIPAGDLNAALLSEVFDVEMDTVGSTFTVRTERIRS